MLYSLLFLQCCTSFLDARLLIFLMVSTNVSMRLICFLLSFTISKAWFISISFSGRYSESILVFYIFFKHFFRNISNAARKISIRPECALLPKMLSQIVLILFPYMVCRVTLHQIYYFTDRHCRFCFYHVMDMAFVSFHISDNHMMFLAYLVRKLFYIIRYMF